MIETLQEFVDSRGASIRLDRQQAVIRGVKVLGLESRNGRSYAPEALPAAVALYEGMRVNVNHPKGHRLAPRDYQDRLGVLRGVEARAGAGLFADLHYNPKHALAEQLLWDAEHAAENVGLSHNVEARTSRQGERVVVEAILKVQSVDLVADPATTRSLFESLETGEASLSGQPEPLEALTLEALRQTRPDLVESILAESALELAQMRAEIERLQTAAFLESKRRLARSLLAEFRLPDPEARQHAAIVGESFLAALLEAPDEVSMRRLVQERARLVAEARRWSGSQTPATAPQSRDQALAEGLLIGLDAKSFARAIR